MSNNRPSKSRTDVIYHRAEITPILNIVNILYEENSANISKWSIPKNRRRKLGVFFECDFKSKVTSISYDSKHEDFRQHSKYYMSFYSRGV